ncbi:MAG: GDP-mannose 4,6-dehydratase, partial [Methanobacterium sp.]|nr:GDP-mannose 4,6-dehydratase [Methanobacterium sp.]
MQKHYLDGVSIIKDKKIVVTGGLGFIGSHIAERLYKDNQVIIVDNESTGKLENLEPLDNQVDLVLSDINTA